MEGDKTIGERIVTEGSTSFPRKEEIISEIGLPTNQMESNTNLLNNSASEEITNASTPPIEDIITEDGILCSILSNLTLREAARTCLLSSRWKHIWTHLPNLIFGAKTIFDDHNTHLLYHDDTPLTDDQKVELLAKKTDQFVHSVNSILRQCQLQGCSRVDEFVVRYYLHKLHSKQLDKWVQFAVSSKTKLLRLYLHKPIYVLHPKKKYDFPFHLLGCSSIEVLILVCCSFKPPCKFDGLRHLKRIELLSIDITTEDINHLFSNCNTLEYLKLHDVGRLVTLSIPHHLSRLQTLIARMCDQLRGEITIKAVNLTNFTYYGCPVDFNFRQSSHLLVADVTFETEVREHNLDFYLSKLTRNLSQLQKLSCTIIGDSEVSVPTLPKESNIFIHLRRLDWCWEVNGKKMSLLHLATLLDAAPFLEVLKLHLGADCIEKVPKRLRKLRVKLPKHPHTHLKTVEFMSYCWDKCHLEFTLYLLKNAVELQSMKIMDVDRKLNQVTTEKLRKQLPENVQLEISGYT